MWVWVRGRVKVRAMGSRRLRRLGQEAEAQTWLRSRGRVRVRGWGRG